MTASGAAPEWTYSEYARLPDDGNRYEVIDGEVCVTRAWGADHPAAAPSLPEGDRRLQFVRKVKLQEQAPVKKGGCG